MAGATPQATPQTDPAAEFGGISETPGQNQSATPAAPAQNGAAAEFGGVQEPESAAPTATISSAHNPSLAEAVQSKDAGGMLKLWAQNVANDIKYGTDVTGVGTVLKKMGAHGVYMGNPAAVGDFMASLPLGLLKAGGGVADAHNHPWQDTKDIVSGAAQAATMPGAFVGPEAASSTLEGAGDVAAAGAGKVVQGVKRVGQAFTESPEIDNEAIKTAAMRGVQPRMASGLRSMMKSLESEAGIEKPAGSPPEAPIEQQSIRDTVKKTSDAFIARARSIYASLDKATGGQFQRFENQLRDVNRELSELVNTPDEASMAKEAELDARRADIEQARDAAFDRAKEQGVDPAQVEGARADFKRGQALKDLDYNIKKVASGGRPSPKMLPEDLAKDPEMLHPERMQKRLDSMYDSGRLQEAVGQENADRMISEASKHKVAVQQATQKAQQAARARNIANRNIRWGVGAAAGTGLLGSAVKGATHVFNGTTIAPVQ
jgi:hypothetical protein